LRIRVSRKEFSLCYRASTASCQLREQTQHTHTLVEQIYAHKVSLDKWVTSQK